jgi:diguanylate cyclase (GGDEF)-like protein
MNTLGACLIIILIAADYLRKFNTDYFQRKLLISVLFAVFVSILLDFLSNILRERTAIYCVISLYLVTRNCGFYLGAVFMDYLVHGDKYRTAKLLRILSAFLGLYAITVILNLPFGYYFTVSADNIFVRENLYTAQLVLSFIPMLIIIAGFILAPKQFKLTHAPLIIVFTSIMVLGAVLNIIFSETSIIWQCVTPAVLYVYFFIIKSNSKIDSLTGIGNRYSFNEFMDKLSGHNEREEYTIAILNIDHFKEINDTHGHLEGDNALRDMAAAIKSSIRHSVMAARYGGDEYVLVTGSNDNIQDAIDRIEEALEKQNLLHSRPYQLYMTYGYDIYTTNSGRSVQDFLDHVESLMYRYKEAKSCLKN